MTTKPCSSLSSKTADPRRSNHRSSSSSRRPPNFQIITTVSLITIIFFTYMFNTNTFISNISFNFTPKSTITTPLLQSHHHHHHHHHLFANNNQTFIVNQLKSTSTIHQDPLLIVKEITIGDDDDHHKDDDQNPPFNLTKKQRIDWFKNNLPEFGILKSNQDFEDGAREFLQDCESRFFMTWIVSSPVRVFGEREFLAVDALFDSNPDACLMILTTTFTDAVYGFRVLKPIVDRGFRVRAIVPDLNFLFDETPARSWFDRIKSGDHDPGEIPLAQNLSNLIRLAVLYKFGGVYLDTDFIPLKDFGSLRNSIGAQSVNPSGNWTRLNNAVLVFDKNHPLLYKFIEEFAMTFNGNKWGFNGPYLVSRVVERESRMSDVDYLNFKVVPPLGFYPVDWTRIGGLFRRPVNEVHRRWVEKKVVQIEESSYGVHLWNKQSRRFRIEEESIMGRLISNHCVICNFFNKTQRFTSETLFIIS